MSYQVIARKWRPQVFEDVIGQDAITQTLRNALEHDRLHHAYLFSGARGVGKTTTARLLAKALNCKKSESPNPKPCNTNQDDACVSCTEVSESRSLDVLEFDAASHTKVDEIREIILEGIKVNPARDRFKAFIIDEVHMLSTSSFNALLKTLEEPPPNVVFVMATTELHKVPDTILSRCQQFDFRTIALQKIRARLTEIAEAEKIDISDGALMEISRSGEGSMRDAQSNFDQVISFSSNRIEVGDVIAALGIASAENLTKTISAIANRDSASMLNIVEDLVERGQDLRNFSRDLLTFIRDLLIVKIASDTDSLLESAILGVEDLKNHAEPFGETDIIRFFNSVAEMESKMRDATEPRYILEIGLIKLIEMRKLAPIEDLVNRLSSIEKAISSSSVSTDRGQTKAADSPVPEKKTLKRPVSPNEVPFPVKNREKQPQPPEEKKDLDEEFEIVVEPPAVSEAVSNTETALEESRHNPIDAEIGQKVRGSIKDLIDPGAMPVKLEPISSEDLDHVEDKKLDAAFELRLRKEGDKLKVFRSPEKLISLLLGREANQGLPESIVSEKESDPNQSVPTGANRALDIVSEMTEYEEIDETIPTLPENPTKEDLNQYAENHPLVKKVIRVFRGNLTKVNFGEK